MDWSRVVDDYCERTDASYWSEPLNAVSNLSFLIAAVVTWRMARAASDRPAQALALGAASVGVGSYLFHTHATIWAMHADVQPIRLLIVAFVGFATVRFFAAPRWVGFVAALAFVPLSMAIVALATPVIGRLNGSVGYLPVPLLMFLIAVALWRRSPETARGLILSGALFVLSLFCRTIDPWVCPDWAYGTHFLWHLLNGAVIGWMIVVFIGAGRRSTYASRPSAAMRSV